MALVKEKTMMIALHLWKNTTKCSCQEIALPMAVRMQSISHCTFPHILDVTGVMEMLPKPWQRQKYIYGRDNLTILYITFALPWATNLICSVRMFVRHVHKDSKHALGQKYMLPSQQSVVQHKAQHTGDVSHLCSKEKTLGVEILCVCTSEEERRGCVFTTLSIGGFIYSMTHPCPFTQK